MDAEGIWVLGPVEVVADGGRNRLTAKQRRLLAVLVLADGRVCGVDELVESLWDGVPPASATKLVQVYISQLRKLLPSAVRISTWGGGYALELDGSFVDAMRFEQLVSESSSAREDGNPALAASLARQALDLWRGRPFGEVAYAEFAQRDVDRLEELHLVATDERLGAELELGRHVELLGEVLAFADENPYRERAQELAMLALYRSGRHTDALDLFASIRARLDDELGLEPGPRIRELQRRILQHEASLEPESVLGAAQSRLPIPPNPLVGRERELEQLGAILARRESRLVVLAGPGGSGKTRLALEIARRAERSFANGAVLVELASLRDPALVVPTIAQALDVPVEHEDDPLAAISDTLAARELLLVVDNAEHLRAAAPCYSQLVARVPRLVILVTSRSVLHISGEHVFPVVPLSEDDAMELFAQRARLLRADFELTSANSEDVREICRRLDCLPLAVELASARIGILTPDALRRRLNTRLGVLATGPRDLPARQQTLRETIAWSVGLLDDSAREVFVRLSVFPAGATIAAAENVCAADLDVLAALVDDNLVRRDDVDGEPRFGMLETVREFALEQLGAELRVTRLKMAAHLAALAESVEVEARANAQALARLDPEIDNVRAALDECAEAGDAQLELRLAGGIWRYWWFRGAPAEGIRSIERALSVDGGVPTPFRAQALRGAAGLAWALGDLERAKELAHATIPVAVEAGSAWDEMAANTVLGLVANAEGDRALARGHHRRSIELAEEVGHEPSAQKLNLGAVALDEGDFGEARVMLEDVLAIHRRNENLEGIGTALLNLGLVHHALGEHRASFEAFQEARSCFEEVGFRAHVAHALQGVAAFEASEGRFAEAVLLLGRARRELDEIGAPEGDVVGEAVSWTKQLALDALGQEEYGRLYSSAHEGKE